MAECRYYGMCARRTGSRNLPRSCDARNCWMFRPMPNVDALLALAEEMQGYADGAASGDGFPYVNAGSLWSYADRIREECGEVVG